MAAEGRARLRDRMRGAGLAAVLLVNPLSLRYLTGFHSNAYSRPLALIEPATGEPILVVPRLEELQARMLTGVTDVRSYVEWDEGSRAGGDLHAEWTALLAEVVAEQGLAGARVGLEAAALGPGREAQLRQALGPAAWVDVSGWIEAQRLLKSPAEVEHHRQAGLVAAGGLDAGVAAARAGASELEIKGASLAGALAAGARLYPDLPVNAAGNALVGERIAAIHAPASGRRPRPGEPVFVVLSTSVGGAHCELSRTIVVGDRGPGEAHRRMGREVARAHEAARVAARVGVPASELDRAARRSLAGAGLGDYLTVRTGHGLGLAPVEAPNLGAGDQTPLRAGMVISIEPGVCVPEQGGILWADNYLVTDGGLTPLTTYPLESW
jgi:Xaa-Pro dipeptidase